MDKNEDGQIYVTQPRKLAADGVTKRVRELLKQEKKYDSSLVDVRHGSDIQDRDGVRQKNTKLTFCTEGYLLHRMKGQFYFLKHENPKFNVKYLVLDEAHEQTEELEFLLAGTFSILFQR